MNAVISYQTLILYQMLAGRMWPAGSSFPTWDLTRPCYIHLDAAQDLITHQLTSLEISHTFQRNDNQMPAISRLYSAEVKKLSFLVRDRGRGLPFGAAFSKTNFA